MDSDRRDSLRREVTLPFQWQALAAPISAAELGKLFHVSPMIQLGARLADLEAEYIQASREVREPATTAALDLINARVTAMQEALFAQHPTPAACAVEISANGIAFATPHELAQQSWVGVHLVLPSCYHVLCMAQICRSERDADAANYRSAAQLNALDMAACRRLSRFVIGNS